VSLHMKTGLQYCFGVSEVLLVTSKSPCLMWCCCVEHLKHCLLEPRSHRWQGWVTHARNHCCFSCKLLLLPLSLLLTQP
jgi:hypothetical protein